MSIVHETGLRPIGGYWLDENSLSAFAMGEERIIQTYRRAIEGDADDASCIELLQE